MQEKMATRDMEANLMSTKMNPTAHPANLIAKTGQGNTIFLLLFGNFYFNPFLSLCIPFHPLEAQMVCLLTND